jgi:cysteine desulfuration protein SufE
MMNMNEIQKEIIAEFEVFEDWLDKYNYLIELSNDLPIMDPKYKTVSLLIRVLSDRDPAEIMDTDLVFIDRIGLRENLSPTRSNGLLSMVKQMKLYALAYKTKMAQQ